jgi:hypothetical protein
MAALTQEVFIKTRLLNKKSFKQNLYLKSSQFNTKLGFYIVLNIQPLAKVAVKYVKELYLYDVQTKAIKIIFVAMTLFNSFLTVHHSIDLY